MLQNVEFVDKQPQQDFTMILNIIAKNIIFHRENNDRMLIYL